MVKFEKINHDAKSEDAGKRDYISNASTNPLQKVLVTSALPYVNNVPHLGNLVCVISADVYTRFLRLKNINVVSILGTDEHGTTSETKALEEGISVKELCDKYAAIHKSIYDWFECEFDCFGRTSSPQNAQVTIDIFKRLHSNGYILEDTLEQLYCEKDKRFLADRFVEGTCPKCNYENARGDQCENCGNLLNAIELINPKCKICKNTPIVKESRHLFIDLPKLQDQLQEWISRVEDKWSGNALTMTNAWLKEGLRKRCITRDLKWGIKVPLEGYEDKVFYSWFDAPIGYIGITKENRQDWHELWHDDKNVKLVQFMGKDNIPFHTMLFPSFLIGTKDKYTLLKEISVNEFLNYEGGQFSKSRNVGVFGDDAQSSGISADAFRYYLMINRPERSDTDFTWDDFQKKNNAELVGNLGNLVNRTTVFLNRSFDSTVPQGSLDDADRAVLESITEISRNVEAALDNISIKEALKNVMHISRLANQYLQDNEPWKNPDPARKATCLYVLANIVKDLSILIEPFMPRASKSIREQLNIDVQGKPSWEDLGRLSIGPGHRINDAKLLFSKIEDAELKILKEKYAGKTKRSQSTPPQAAQNPFDRIQVRVAQITHVEPHPKAQKLYIEHIDLGDEQRVIVSGLVPHYDVSALVGKRILVVTNLAPANLRGVVSNGMLLAAQENDLVGLVMPDAPLGSYAYTDKSRIDAIKQLPQITIDDFAKSQIVAKDGVISCDGKQLHVDGTLSIDKGIMNGTVR